VLHLGRLGLVLFALLGHDYLPFLFLPIFMGFPVFFASFFAAAIPALLYENSFFPTFGIVVLSLPLHFISPVCSAHFALGNVLCVTSLKGFTAFPVGG